MFKNLSFGVIRVNVRVSQEDKFHVDTLDVYNSRHCSTFLNMAAEELKCKPEVVKRDLGLVMLKLEEIQAEHINQTMEPESDEVVLTEEERKQAVAYLQQPNLLDTF